MCIVASTKINLQRLQKKKKKTRIIMIKQSLTFKVLLGALLHIFDEIISHEYSLFQYYFCFILLFGIYAIIGQLVVSGFGLLRRVYIFLTLCYFKKEKDDNPVLKLNVGGKWFTTFKSTLFKIPEPFLSSIIGPGRMNDNTRTVFIDRNPDNFGLILDYLRTDKIPYFQNIEKKNAFYRDLDEFGLSSSDIGMCKF